MAKTNGKRNILVKEGEQLSTHSKKRWKPCKFGLKTRYASQTALNRSGPFFPLGWLYLTSHGLKISVWANGTARRRNLYAALKPIRTDPVGNLIIPRGHTPYLFEHSSGSGRHCRQ